jgi:cysteine desulfurase
VTYLKPDAWGVVTPQQVMEAVTEQTVLVSVMYANNEIGTVEPVNQIGRMLKSQGILFHTDAVQGFGYERLNLSQQPIDLLSMSGHKIYGPKGIGFLYIRKGTPISPLLYGGSQEDGMRPGTESLPLIVGLSNAVASLYQHQSVYAAHALRCRNYLCSRILNEIPNTMLVGTAGSVAGNVYRQSAFYAPPGKENRQHNRYLPNLANIIFREMDSAQLLQQFNANGICASAGSACHANSGEPSYVLQAIGLEKNEARGAIRFSFGKDNTKEEIDRCVALLKHIFVS